MIGAWRPHKNIKKTSIGSSASVGAKRAVGRHSRPPAIGHAQSIGNAEFSYIRISVMAKMAVVRST